MQISVVVPHELAGMDKAYTCFGLAFIYLKSRSVCLLLKPSCLKKKWLNVAHPFRLKLHNTST